MKLLCNAFDLTFKATAKIDERLLDRQTGQTDRLVEKQTNTQKLIN